MPTNTITAATSLNGLVAQSIYVPESATIAPTGSPVPLDLSNGYYDIVRIDGVLHGDTSPALAMVSSSYNVVHLGARGKLISNSTYGGYVAGDGNAMTSAGKIKGVTGIVFIGADTHFQNSGTVIGTGALNSEGVVIVGASGGTLENTGHIRGDVAGVDLNSPGAMVMKSGTIRGDHGIDVNQSGFHLVNHGAVLGVSVGLLLQDGATVENYGRIAATGAAMTSFAIEAGSTNAINIVNHGRIDGNVLLGSGPDLFENTGRHRVAGLVQMGDGNDVALGGSGGDRFDGNGGGDTLLGGGGHDKLIGDAGSDQLDGGRGGDRLDGGDGNDLLTGGKGDDRLIGRSGADVLIFSGRHPGDDTMRDWESGTDIVDLTAYHLTPAEQAQFIAHAQSHDHGELVLDLGWIDHVHGTLTFHMYDTELTVGDFAF